MRRSLAVLAVPGIALSLLSAGASSAATRHAAGADATVIAIVDDSFNPYHLDFLASQMPQHRDGTRANDLPLTRAPHEWLSGFPKPSTFDSYDRFPITLPRDGDESITELMGEDEDRWSEDVGKSRADEVAYHWIPGTKFVGMLDFGSSGSPLAGTGGHGVGTTSVSSGNIHGTCPECLVVFIRYGSDTQEAALRWAMSQPWIDIVSNSYGHGAGKVYDGPSRLDQRDASVRGQTVVFSGGNGMENAYVVPNHTYASSQKGPDWLITVGAVGAKSGGSYGGAGKMVDVAGVGDSYPSAYTASTTGGTGPSGFGGTSNAAPTVAGTYARALYYARRDLAGPSRTQAKGVVATGKPYRCGAARKACELADGKLTAVELRTRLLHGAVHTTAGFTTGNVAAPDNGLPVVGEEEFMNEGHGTYLARSKRDDAKWNAEFQRVLAPLEGRAAALQRPAGEKDWMVVDSYCKQKRFGVWPNGYYVTGKTTLPGPAPTTPVRNAMAAACTALPQTDG